MGTLKPETFVVDFFSLLDRLLATFVKNGYNAIAAYLAAPLGVLTLIVIALMGWKVWIEGDVKLNEFLKMTITLAMVYMFALNWANFSFYVIGWFNGIMNGVSGALLKANPIPHSANANTLNGAIQGGLDSINMVSSDLFKAGGFGNWAYIVYGLLVDIFGLFMAALMILEIAVAKIMMAILFTIAPVVIPSVLFKKFVSMFDNWLGLLFGFVFLYIMITAVLVLSLSFVWWVLPHAVVGAPLSDGYFDGFAKTIGYFIVIAIIIICLILKVSVKAMHIGGGVSGAGAGAVIGGALAGAGFSAAAMKKSFKAATGGYKAGKWGAGKARGALRKLRGGE